MAENTPDGRVPYREDTDELTDDETIAGLQYIADSPPREHGGFHPRAVAIARAGLAMIARLQAQAAPPPPGT